MKDKTKTHTVSWFLKRDEDGAKHYSPNRFTEKRAEELAKFANIYFEQATHLAERISDDWKRSKKDSELGEHRDHEILGGRTVDQHSA